jgi:glycosyltransferase involved in cell wall biosynthesis
LVGWVLAWFLAATFQRVSYILARPASRAGGRVSTKTLVSSIIAFKNSEKFLEEAVESVIAQTYDNWELLLVDDGSTDSSTAIALRYAEQSPETVHYLEHAGHQNLGAAASRNLGFRYARGEYVALLDSDDVWLPHKLEDQVAILDSHPEAGMVFGQSQRWHSWTTNPEDIQHDFVPRAWGTGGHVV